jgi:Protein of unknown function (DUF4239)
MNSPAISSIVFACVAGSALLGMLLRRILPEHHLAAESKDVVKLGIGLIGTMAALVLGLMVGSAKSSYDAQKNNLAQLSVKIVLLDRALAHYGPDAKEPRETLRTAVDRILAGIWPDDRSQPAQLNPTAARAEVVYDQIQGLAPKTDAQRTLQGQALAIALDIGQLRWSLFQQSGSAISTPFVVVLVFWLSVIFASFGLMAPANPTTIVTLLLCTLSVSGAIFLILELDRPFDGLIQIPSTPLRNALAQLGQ